MINIGAYAGLPLATSSSSSANVKGELEDPATSADDHSGSFIDALNGISQSSEGPSGPGTGANENANPHAGGAAALGPPASLSRLRLPEAGQGDLRGFSSGAAPIQTRPSAPPVTTGPGRVNALSPEPDPRGEAAGAAMSLSTGASSWRAKSPSVGQLKIPAAATAPDSKTGASRETAKTNERNIATAQTEKATQAAAEPGAGHEQTDGNGQSVINGLWSRPMRDAPSVNAKSIDHKRRASDEPSAPAASASTTAPGVVAAPLVVPVLIAASLKTPSDAPDTMDRPSLAGLPTSFSKDDGGVEDSSHKDAAPMKVDVLGQATHFAPVAQLSAPQQIVSRIIPTLGSFGAAPDSGGVSSSSSVAASVEPGAGTAAVSQSPVKTLDLQLEPESLGSVTIKLNLSSAGLVVDVQTSQAATANLLEKDKNSLADGLANAGYVVSAVDINAVPQSAAGAGPGDGAQNKPGGTYDGASQNNSGSQGQGSGAQNSPPRHYHQQGLHETLEPARSGARRSAGGLYI